MFLYKRKLKQDSIEVLTDEIATVILRHVDYYIEINNNVLLIFLYYSNPQTRVKTSSFPFEYSFRGVKLSIETLTEGIIVTVTENDRFKYRDGSISFLTFWMISILIQG